MKQLSLLGGALALALSACVAETNLPSEIEVGLPGDGDASDPGNQIAQALTLEGSVGRVNVDTSHFVRSEVFNDSFSTWISLTAPQADGGAIMGGLMLDGIDLTTLAAGTTVHASPWSGQAIRIEGPDGNVEERDEGDIWIDGIGCSGETDGNWDVDEPAEDIVIVIEEGDRPDEVIVEFTADYSSGTLIGAAALTR